MIIAQATLAISKIGVNSLQNHLSHNTTYQLKVVPPVAGKSQQR